MTRRDTGSGPLQDQIAALTQSLVQAGRSSAEAARQAYGLVYARLVRRAQPGTTAPGR